MKRARSAELSVLHTSNTQPTPSVFRRFRQYLRDFKLAFLFAAIGMIGYSSLDVLVISQLEPLIDKSLGGGDYQFLRMAAYLIVPIFILRGVFNFIGSYTLQWIGTSVVMRMRQHLFNHYMYLPVSFFDQHSSGALISKVIYDTEQVANAAGKALAILVREGALVIGLLVMMFWKSWQLSLVFLLIGPLVAVVVSVVSKRFRKVSRNIQQAMGTLTTGVEQAVKGHKVVLMFGGQDKEAALFEQKNNHNRQQNMKLYVAQILSVSTIQIIASIALAVVLYIASVPQLVESLTAGVFVSVVMGMTMLLKPLKQLTTVNSEFQRGMAACTSIFDILDEHTEQNRGSHSPEQVQGKVEYNNVTFSYPGVAKPALKNINFTLQAGKTLALVGRSGSGKSTISSLLTRFYQAQQGDVLLDGVSINDYDLKNLRSHCALVSQHVTLFNDTIANNIAYGSEGRVTRAQILMAADAAHVTEFAEQLELGLDTMIGENGLMLSGGQRQRIAIARAILRDAPILILDEATSALDTESERLIQDALDTLQQNRTCIIIAHRLSTIEKADEILVVEKGEIIEQGDHQSLLAKDGAYAALHKMQFSEG